jgi:peptidoglycan endopeptidase LytE
MNRTARIILATGVALTVALPLAGGVASAAPAGTATTDTRTTTETTVTVRDGDSLAGLAWRHGVRLSALLQANSLELTSVIHPGQTLVIPAGARLTTTATSPAAGSSAAAVTTATPAPAASGTDYTVVAGDALASIAWRNGVSLGALLRANGIEASSLIMPGQRLQIPPATRPIPTGIINTAATTASPAPNTSSTTASTPTPAPAPAATGSSLDTLLSYATAQVGVPYQFFSAGPDTFDCSGLVVAAFRQIGMSVPHQSRALAKLGSPVDWRAEPIAAGDLVFTSSIGDPAHITHVGIALDSQRWVHAVGRGSTVSIHSMPAPDRIMAVQRIALP